jgi:twitching motility protein PilT
MDSINDYITPAPKLSELLITQVKLGASDLHLAPLNKPRVRINGNLVPLEDYDPLATGDTKVYADSILSAAKKQLLDSELQADASIAIKGLSRFRVNVCHTRGGLALAFRAIPFEPFTFDQLGVPKNMVELANRPYGLVLVTGPTGCGKSTTLAAFIDKLNRERSEKIITIEDPIEFLHPSKGCLVQQRELETNTKSFASAVKNAVREDPNIVLIGELRDLATIQEALRVAETGHLTFATLHSNTAPSTITRIIDVFPAVQQPQIRTQLADVLAGVMSQQLLQRKDGKGRVMALETMIPTPAIKNLIRENKIHQIKTSMATGQDTHGMVTMSQSLARLVAESAVTREEAERFAPDIEDFKSQVGVFQTTERTRIPASIRRAS